MKWKNLHPKYQNILEGLKNKSPYDILRVSPNSSEEDIKKAYKKLVKIYHPDISDPFLKKVNEDILKIINSAYHSIAKRF